MTKAHVYKRSGGKLLRWDGERWEEREVSIDYVAPALPLAPYEPGERRWVREAKPQGEP